jgi:hypothetical protein
MPSTRLLLISTMLAVAAGVTAAAAQSLCNPCVDPPLHSPELFERRPPIGPDYSVHSRARCGIAIPRTYGGSEWLVAECVDGGLVVAPATGIIARGSYFTFSRVNEGGYRLDEQGTSPGTREQAAYVELRALGWLEIAALVAAVRLNACRRGQVRSCSGP